MSIDSSSAHGVNFAEPRSFPTVFKSNFKETLFPDDPFGHLKNEPSSRKTLKVIEYFLPIFGWLPRYNLALFKYDLLAGITIASLAIPQGISYAKLAEIDPIIGLYSSFVPPLIYALFGSSKHLAVGTVAASSLIIAASIEEVVPASEDPILYTSLVFTSTLISGLVMLALGVFRLGILVDFLSHSTITGFMGGTAVLICLQQLKGMLGLKHFTTHTDCVSVVRAVFKNRKEWQWESALVGIIFLAFLQFTRFVKQRRPKLFWVSAIAPIVTVIVGGLFAYFGHADKHGIPIVGALKKGINPLSINRITFDPKYIAGPLKGGVVTAMIAIAEGIAIGRSFAIMKNEQIDGNKEMLAFGLMNIVGSLTSCYLTTGPFSKTAVNFNAGCRTQMSNVVMAICMMLTLLFLAPLFSYTPLVALAAIIMSAMLGLIEYEKAYHLYKTDKFDFVICMAAFFGVVFISMDMGLCLSVGLALIRALVYVARPATCKLGHVHGSNLYRDVEQYPNATDIPGILAIQLGSPIYYANSQYIRERILRYLKTEQSDATLKGTGHIEYILLDLGGVSSIDITGVEAFVEIMRILESKEIKMILINPRLGVMEKLTVTKFVEKVGKESIFLSIADAIESCKFSMKSSKGMNVVDVNVA
ncbi:probable sulfate transporter 3.5 [Coffea eugenioides]|uniref:probable sulfate transporter 3.5 n=1 Tax=Coffea eugenioides TaxID=49369 RepID=UPI000F615411|nr:probable sulfate transporter 3.5 [Coffea eugenioides]